MEPYTVFFSSLPVSDHLSRGKPRQFTHSVRIQQDVVGAQTVVKDWGLEATVVSVRLLQRGSRILLWFIFIESGFAVA